MSPSTYIFSPFFLLFFLFTDGNFKHKCKQRLLSNIKMNNLIINNNNSNSISEPYNNSNKNDSNYQHHNNYNNNCNNYNMTVKKLRIEINRIHKMYS